MLAILNRMRTIKSPTELQSALDALRTYIPLDSLVYPSINDAIRAVERSLVKVALLNPVSNSRKNSRLI